ncbi:hypothetical protein ACH4PR_51750 [Streptomyces mirabilis]|uniref:hypothetical protein n=1 Tax=Streptomyces mirabilis TaxID=68239 RepID=UPI0037A2C44C
MTERPSLSRRWLVYGIAIALLAIITAGATLWVTREDDADKALTFARKACKAINLDSHETADSQEQAADQAHGWSDIADNAARAARLDRAWNELARATDVQYRAWNLSAQGADQALIDAAAAEAVAHPVDPECRKALVH